MKIIHEYLSTELENGFLLYLSTVVLSMCESSRRGLVSKNEIYKFFQKTHSRKVSFWVKETSEAAVTNINMVTRFLAGK